MQCPLAIDDWWFPGSRFSLWILHERYRTIPYRPCMVYLPIQFTVQIHQMKVNIIFQSHGWYWYCRFLDTRNIKDRFVQQTWRKTPFARIWQFWKEIYWMNIIHWHWKMFEKTNITIIYVCSWSILATWKEDASEWFGKLFRTIKGDLHATGLLQFRRLHVSCSFRESLCVVRHCSERSSLMFLFF